MLALGTQQLPHCHGDGDAPMDGCPTRPCLSPICHGQKAASQGHQMGLSFQGNRFLSSLSFREFTQTLAWQVLGAFHVFDVRGSPSSVLHSFMTFISTRMRVFQGCWAVSALRQDPTPTPVGHEWGNEGMRVPAAFPASPKHLAGNRTQCADVATRQYPACGTQKLRCELHAVN